MRTHMSLFLSLCVCVCVCVCVCACAVTVIWRVATTLDRESHSRSSHLQDEEASGLHSLSDTVYKIVIQPGCSMQPTFWTFPANIPIFAQTPTKKDMSSLLIHIM